jgi:hypothetical protein
MHCAADRLACIAHKSLKICERCRLDGLFASFLRPNANYLLNRDDKDSSVADLFCTGRTKDRIHRSLNPRIRNHNFEFYLGHKRAVVLIPCVGHRMPSLTAKPFDFREGHSVDTDFGQGILHFIHLKRPDDRLDLLHPNLAWIICNDDATSAFWPISVTETGIGTGQNGAKITTLGRVRILCLERAMGLSRGDLARAFSACVHGVFVPSALR